ncbi:glycine--tRNA ligase subunit beta [Acidicapsa ligni]|uniref:glycine--tRNA ligase subunit beta n=1 Tax=Acidicapsa ligni TaxID=542300 RepID=UPI0021E01C8E|nr:glycine--tRNA ligase subunit beta [Acidicapsa ligni]
MADFLFEIGLEEVPARMIAAAEAELSRRVEQLLVRERLLAETYSVQSFSTPRRLAVLVSGVLAGQADIEEQLTGPSWKVAFNNDAPTPAAIAFAKKAGVEISALEKVTTPKGEYVGATVRRAGRQTAELLAASLPAELTSIYWPKNMYWRLNKPERFVRPVRWLVALLDDAIVPVEFGGIAAGNSSRGHRVLHGDAPVLIARPADYLETLHAVYVNADVAARRHTIRKALDHVTRTVPGARWREDEALIESVVHLTEWPTVLLGSFEPEYLSLPEEVLVTVMRDHQKYFAVEDADGMLAPHFLTVLNTQVDEQGRATIRHGNERVLRSRFKDAQFFWEADQKTLLTERVEMLKAVTFQKELGSYFWKTEGNLRIAEQLAANVQAKGKVLDKVALLQAALLAKTDLTAELVKEFTELQGIVGGLYAKAQGLGDAVAAAIYAQYTPASIEDDIPETIEGQLLGIADRIHTISAMFGIGNAPTGSRDPFALRRNANAIIKILAESELPLTLAEVVSISGAESDAVPSFLAERLSFYLKDVRGFAYDVVSAVLAVGADDVRDAIARAEALTAVRGSEDFVAISAAFKRIKNILRQAAEKDEPLALNTAFSAALIEAEERDLYAASSKLAAIVSELREEGNYAAALAAIAMLRPAVDAFFDKVMVMSPEPDVRAARLALIQSVLDGFSGIADFSEIVTA